MIRIGGVACASCGHPALYLSRCGLVVHTDPRLRPCPGPAVSKEDR